MESSLSKSEMDAVFQLIELSGSCADDLRVYYWVNFPADKEEEEEEEEDGSVGESSSSSSLINQEKLVVGDEDSGLPRNKTRFGSLVNIYRKTDLIRNRTKKRPRF